VRRLGARSWPWSADGYGHGAVTADGGRCASPPLEIQTNGLFDTQAKYDGSARFSVPADVDGADRAALTGAALRMFDALGCAGVARIDFFLTDDGPVLNEVTTMPGMTAESQVPRMFAAAGLPYEQLVARLVDAATVPGPTNCLGFRCARADRGGRALPGRSRP
jgi:D-alanine-D-alanine ligase